MQHDAKITNHGQHNMTLHAGGLQFGFAPSYRALGWYLHAPEMEDLSSARWIDDEDRRIVRARFNFERLLSTWQARIQCAIGPEWPTMTGWFRNLCDLEVEPYGGGSLTICLSKRQWCAGSASHASMNFSPEWFGGRKRGFLDLPEDEWCEVMGAEIKKGLENGKISFQKEEERWKRKSVFE